MAVTPEAQRLTEQFNTVVANVRSQTALAVIAAWRALAAYDEDLLPGFLATVVPLVRGAQAAVVAAVDAYMAAFVSLETGVPIPPAGLVPDNLVGAAVRNGVDPDEVYRRPFVTVWSELKAGTPIEQSTAKAEQRLDAIVQSDVMLAHRAAADEWMRGDDRIVGYRRVLSGTSCGLCAIASTQRYKVGTLMPIHGRCDCTVEPIVANVDSMRRVIEPERLAALKAQLGQDYSNRAALKRERVEEDGETLAPRDLPEVRVEQHGELGPVLIDARHAFKADDRPLDVAA